MSIDNAKLWGGRFAAKTNEFVKTFTESVSYDQHLHMGDGTDDIVGIKTLTSAGVLTQRESDQIIASLNAIKADIDAGKFNWSIALEDVHMNIEAELIDRIGETGKKLNTGRSRNDQVSADIRL